MEHALPRSDWAKQTVWELLQPDFASTHVTKINSTYLQYFALWSQPPYFFSLDAAEEAYPGLVLLRNHTINAFSLWMVKQSRKASEIREVITDRHSALGVFLHDEDLREPNAERAPSSTHTRLS